MRRVEVPHFDGAIEIAGTRSALREIVDGSRVSPDEHALVGSRVGREPAGHRGDLLVLPRESAGEAFREREDEIRDRRNAEARGDGGARRAGLSLVDQSREPGRRGERERRDELQVVVLVEPAADRHREPRQPERYQDGGADRVAGERARLARLLDGEDPGDERDADAEHGRPGESRERRAGGAYVRIEKVPDEHPVEKLGKMALGSVEAERHGPRTEESEQQDRAAPHSGSTAPEQRDGDSHPEHRRLVLEERGDRDRRPAKEVEAGPPRFLLGAHGAEERERDREVHEQLGIDRRDLAEAGEERDPGRGPPNIVACGPLPCRFAEDQAGGNEPRDTEEVVRKQRKPAEEPSHRVGEIGEGRLDVDRVDVGQAAVEDAATDEAEEDLVEIQDVEEEGGGPQRDRGRDQRPKRTWKKTHYPTSSLMSTMAGAGASRRTRAGPMFRRKPASATWMRSNSHPRSGKCIGRRREPATSTHRRSGTSRKSSCVSPAARSLPISSTSNAHRAWNGSASAISSAGLARNALAPHCVSYTGSRRTIEAKVAKMRPR